MLHKAFQFCYCNVGFTAVARKHKYINTYTSENSKILMDIFGFNRSEVTILMAQKSMHTKEPGELIDSFKFYKKLGFSKHDLLKHPTLLVSHPTMKINHYNSLQDTGCRPIDPYLLSRASYYFRRKILVLKQDGYLAKDDNVADHLLSILVPPIKKPEKLKQKLKVLDEMTWTEVHRAILVDWLKKRLNVTDEDLLKLLRIHKMIKNKSFRTINENITLAESLGLSVEKILKCGYLMNNHPEYPKTMLCEHPYFAGIDIARAYKVNPKMMMVSPRRIKEVYAILKEFNVSDEIIQNKADVFTISPITLRTRLIEIQNIPEFRVLFNDPAMLKLVVHHNKIKSRLSFLKSLKLRCASLSSMGALVDKEFENYIQQGKDINRPPSVVDFFSRLLDKKREDVQKKLERHPYYYYVPFLDIDKTFQYLLQLRYSKENIARCLFILLYPRQKIKTAITQLRADRSLRFHELSQSKQLNLILYCIEKKHHFTGKGIWKINLNTDNVIEEHTLE